MVIIATCKDHVSFIWRNWLLIFVNIKMFHTTSKGLHSSVFDLSIRQVMGNIQLTYQLSYWTSINCDKVRFIQYIEFLSTVDGLNLPIFKNAETTKLFSQVKYNFKLKMISILLIQLIKRFILPLLLYLSCYKNILNASKCMTKWLNAYHMRVLLNFALCAPLVDQFIFKYKG